MLDVSRKELKYLLPLQAVYQIKHNLEKVMQLDAYAGQEGYRVMALFYESKSFAMMQQFLFT